jgi:hypothetical protein
MLIVPEIKDYLKKQLINYYYSGTLWELLFWDPLGIN